LDAFKALPEPVKITIIAIGGLIVLLAQLGPVLMGLAALVQLLGGAGAGGGLLAGFGAAIGSISLPVAALVIAIGALIAVFIIFGRDALKTFTMVAEMGPKLFIAGFNRIIFEVKKWINTFISNIRALGKLTAAEWTAIGKAIPAAILGGIKAGWNALIAGVKTLINDLLKQFDLELKIGSPSKVFMERGVNSAQGYGQGFAAEMLAQARGLASGSLGALGGGGDQNINVRTMEIHGRMSSAEMAYFDQRQDAIAQRAILKALKNRRLP
jgi:hypothetical protein